VSGERAVAPAGHAVHWSGPRESFARAIAPPSPPARDLLLAVRMSKNIVFCADGTWNGPGQDVDHDRTADPTNVFKAFANLAGVDTPETTRLADEQERVLVDAAGRVVQIAKYLHGVGDSSNFLVRALGGAAGAGVIARIVRGYTFVSRNYENGDRIFLLGFSRGAYTARALAGLIVARGLLDASKNDLTDKERAYRLGSAEWFEYRRRALKNKPNVFHRLKEVLFDLPGFLMQPPLGVRIEDVPIEAVAVWDTVGALGIPQYNLTIQNLDAYQFADTRLSSKVKHGLHALAADEERGNFVPTLWDADPRIVQVIFPGAHSDVGGGFSMLNDESDLSDGGLAWMTDELKALGVLFAAAPTYVPSPDARGLLHRPWLQPPWVLLPAGPREFPAGLALHRSVLVRLQATGGVLEELATKRHPYEVKSLEHYVQNGEIQAGVQLVG